MVRARGKDHRSAAGSCECQFRQHVAGVGASQRPAAGQRCRSCIAGRCPGSFRRQCAVGGAGTNDNPMRVVTLLSRESEQPGKSRSCLKRNSVAALCCVQCLLQICTGLNGMLCPGRRRVAHGTVDVHARQFRRPIGGGCTCSGDAQAQVREAPCPEASDTETEIGNAPFWLVIPSIAPAFPFSTNPAGNVPEAKFQW